MYVDHHLLKMADEKSKPEVMFVSANLSCVCMFPEELCNNL